MVRVAFWDICKHTKIILCHDKLKEQLSFSILLPKLHHPAWGKWLTNVTKYWKDNHLQTRYPTADYPHYSDIIMSMVASQITSLTIVYSAIYLGTDERNHQSSVSLAFVREFTSDRWITYTKCQ